jgi:hypothetical protein
MACNPIVFQNISRERFLAIRARIRAQAAEVEIDGDTGTASGNTPLGRVKLAWVYDGSGQTFTVQCLAKPMFVSESVVATKIHGLMEAL